MLTIRSPIRSTIWFPYGPTYPPLDLTVHYTVSIRSTIRSFFVVLYGPHTVSYGLHTVGHTVPRTVPRHSVQIGVPYGPHTVPIRFPYAFHRGSYGFHTVPIRFHTVSIRSPYPPASSASRLARPTIAGVIHAARRCDPRSTLPSDRLRFTPNSARTRLRLVCQHPHVTNPNEPAAGRRISSSCSTAELRPHLGTFFRLSTGIPTPHAVVTF